MPGLVLTATGTDVGKTFVACGLLRAGLRAGFAMDALKPVLTGYTEADMAASDAGRLIASLGRRVDAAAIDAMAPFRFAAPLAPNMAAVLEGRALDVDAVIAACRAACGPNRLTLIEGIGGVMVPLDDRHTVLDLVAALNLPTVLVSGTGLGAISHCLSAYEVLRRRGVPPVSIVLNESADSTVPLPATQATIAGFCADASVTVLPRDADGEAFDALLRRLQVDIGRTLPRTDGIGIPWDDAGVAQR